MSITQRILFIILCILFISGLVSMGVNIFMSIDLVYVSRAFKKTLANHLHKGCYLSCFPSFHSGDAVPPQNLTNVYKYNIARYTVYLLMHLILNKSRANKMKEIESLTVQTLLYINDRNWASGCIWSKTNTSNTDLYIVFRGTQTVQDAMVDIDYPQLHPKELYSGSKVFTPDVLVHQGFYESYMRMRSDILRVVDELAKRNSTLQIIVCGHSLGSAYATLCYVDLCCHLRLEDSKTLNMIAAYVFASPRVGNPAFQNFVRKSGMHENFYSFINTVDIVPQMPPGVSPNVMDPANPWIFDYTVKDPWRFDMNWSSVSNNHLTRIYYEHIPKDSWKI